jgi:hypothetical protein
MTGHDTVGYNIAWFSPQPTFTDVGKVCWDINETAMSRRKWTQVVFVPHADAIRYPAGATNNELPSNTSRGTGGFDLGFVNPDFRSANGPTDGIVSHSGTFGFRDLDGSASTFLDGTNLSQFVGPDGAGREQTSDKAARYTHCLENAANNTVTYTKDTPVGTFVRTLQGQIPQGDIRVVFEDDEYDGMKDSPAGGQPDGRYDPNVLTWHWDNIQVFATDSTPVTTTSSSTSSSTSTASSTSQPPTTTSTSTTVPSSTTTTVKPTTTTIPGSTTTTLPALVCPAGFTTPQRTWCLNVNAHIAALEAKVH